VGKSRSAIGSFCLWDVWFEVFHKEEDLLGKSSQLGTQVGQEWKRSNVMSDEKCNLSYFCFLLFSKKCLLSLTSHKEEQAFEGTCACFSFFKEKKGSYDQRL